MPKTFIFIREDHSFIKRFLEERTEIEAAKIYKKTLIRYEAG